MASLFQPFSNDNDKDKQQQGDGATSQPMQPQSITGASQSSTITAGGNSNPNGQTGTSSGSFTNLQKYMDANKGFNNGNGLGGMVADNINNQVQSTKQQTDAAGGAFKQQAQQNVNAFNVGQDFVNQGLQNATQFVQNQDNVNKFAAARDAQYTGPKSLADMQGDNNLANLQIKAQSANDNAQQGQTESGRFNLLRQMFGNPNYSQGQQSLDNLLIQGDQDQLRRIQATRPEAANAFKAVNDTNQQAQQTAQQAQQTADQVRTYTRNAIDGSMNTFDQGLQSKVDAAKAQNTQIAADLAKRQLTSDEAKRLGLSGMDQLYGVNASRYLNQVDPTKQTVANADDYARYGALAQLANVDKTTLVDPSQAGKNDTYQMFDKDNFNQAVANQKQAYESQYNPAQWNYNHDFSKYYNAIAQTINDQYNLAKNGGMVTKHDGQGEGSTDYQAMQDANPELAAKLAPYVNPTAMAPGNTGGWQGVDDWTSQNQDAIMKSNLLTKDKAAELGLLGLQGMSGSAAAYNLGQLFDNKGMAGQWGNIDDDSSKLAQIQKLFDIGNGLKVGS